MKLFYIANIRIPTEKAHGVAIVKACEAFARAGVETALVVPKRRTPFEKNVYETYGVERNFRVRFLPTLDLLTERSGPFIFWLQTVTFQLSLVLYLLFKSRRIILYTRDPHLISLRYLGYKVAFECHLISKNRKTFFSLAKKASKIVVISEALKRAFLEAGFGEKDILVAPSGVDLSIFDIETSKEEARRILKLPEDEFLAAYTGNFTTMGADKGISDILKALSGVRDVIFVAVGGAHKDIVRYKKEAHDLEVSDQAIFRGSTTQHELALYQKAADVLLMPFPDTPHYRNHMSPVKMFEYMVAKRPIIASDLPTIREVLNEHNAVIVQPGNSEELAKALQSLIYFPENGEKTAAQAYNDVAQFSWDARTKKILMHIE
jgi:glycosyltransferase involved in cell wall biosynthesis